LPRSRELIPIEIDPEISRAPILLDIPMIRIACMGSVFDPDPVIFINISLLPRFRTVPDRGLPDNVLTLSVLVQLRNERDFAASRQSGFLDLPVDLVG
jgi:hypothetical protein